MKEETREKEIYDASKLMIKDFIPNKNVKPRKNKNNVLEYVYLLSKKDNIFDSKDLVAIIKALVTFKNLKERRFLNVNLVIDMTKILSFADKNTYILLDLAFYNLIKDMKPKEKLIIPNNFGNKKTISNMLSGGLLNTALLNSLLEVKQGAEFKVGWEVDKQSFLNYYVKNNFENPKIHELLTNKKPNNGLEYYRRIITKSEFTDLYLESKIMTELKAILDISFPKEINWCWEVREVIMEVISNAQKHNDLFILIDLDLSNEMIHIKNGKEYSALNISLINIGYNNLYDLIKYNVKECNFNKEVSVYEKVYDAYQNHLNFFNNNNNIYSEDFFFMITAFQNGVTTKYVNSKIEEDDGEFSGTGLTKLISNITEKTVDDISYVMSDNLIIKFDKEYLALTPKKIGNSCIGFNNNNDYINRAPNEKFLRKSAYKVPGTIYQLHLLRNKNDCI